MGYNTKIDWCDSSWNPVTGCKHSCEYCYARKIAKRFGGASETHNNECCHECQWITEGTGEIHDLDEPVYDFDNGRNAPYPFDFDPTFHRYKLDEPQHWKKPRNVFVCSMGDLFGDWIPIGWIQEVFTACRRAPQHRYLFLTKNPSRYKNLNRYVYLPTYEETDIEKSEPHIMLGASATNNAQMKAAFDSDADWVSIEPIHESLLSEWFTSFIGSKDGPGIWAPRWKWVVIGAETGNRQDKIIPKKEWVQEIADICMQEGTPVFMKESLRDLMGDEFRQEFPWEV